TREMTAVDLEALGLSADAGVSMPRMSVSRAIGGIPALRPDSTPELDVELAVDADAPELVTAEREAVEPPAEPEPEPERKKPLPGSRHKTVALSEEDLEEVRAATQEALAQQQQQ